MHREEITAEEHRAVCMASGSANAEIGVDLAPTQTARQYKDAPIVCSEYIVRRLTPVECERLQGFPDGWTDLTGIEVDDGLIERASPSKDAETLKKTGRNLAKWSKECPDSPRYKAMGNSMAVPVMRWIGERLVRALEEE